MKIFGFVKRNWFNLFIYLSLIYVIIYLKDTNMLFMPHINNYFYLAFSLVFLVLGFIFEMYGWKYILNVNTIKTNNKNIVISSGSAILGKYLPGKIWTVMGRAKIISDYYKVSLVTTSAISFEAQIIVLWTGLVISLVGVVIVKMDYYYLFLIVFFLLVFTIIIFFDKYKFYIENILNRFFKKKISIAKSNFNIQTLLIYFLPWISWSIGFFLLSASILTNFSNYGILFVLPFSVTFGVLALFSPGGIGVREGIITLFLTVCGMDISSATTISVFSRLWFLIGELVIFTSALILTKLTKVEQLNNINK